MTFIRTPFMVILFFCLILATPFWWTPLSAAQSPYFRITVIDRETGRGIPAVRLQTVSRVQYWTDNNGVVAFHEPDLIHQKVWFTVETHGYVCESESMGIPGVALNVEPGGSATITMRRINLAKRLYRMTGSGMYRDSSLLGDKVPPIPEPGKVPVMGQDGGDMVLFHGRCHWLWGDTSIARFPLGIYQSVSAISDLPEKGGLDPDQGVILRYLRNKNGDIRSVINKKFEGGKADWYSRPRVALDKEGREHFLTEYIRVNAAMEPQERGLLEYNEKTGFFDQVAQYADHPAFAGHDGGSALFRHTIKGKEYFYAPGPFPDIRYPADYELQSNLGMREAFTCLKEGLRFDGSASQLDREPNGQLRWGWKKNTSPVAFMQMNRLVKDGLMKNEERWYSLYDIDTGKSVIPHQGSVYWNSYRKRWISIFAQLFGETLAGEIWYSEADTPQGPWVYAKKIITHKWKDQDSSYYLPAPIPEFEKNAGRTIYIKGSFSAFLGEMKTAVPRHDYNIMVYQLELDDVRLFLPVPVYQDKSGLGGYGTRRDIKRSKLDLAWFAFDRFAPGTIAVYQIQDENGIRLTTESVKNGRKVFYALPADDQYPAPVPRKEEQKERSAEKDSSTVLAVSEVQKMKNLDIIDIPPVRPVALYEFAHSDGKRHYSINASWQKEGYVRQIKPLCLVWPSPILYNPYGNTDMRLW